jgi:IrrE N-terminal-like domain
MSKASNLMNQLLQSERDVLARYQTSAPVDVVGIARALGLSVWEDDLPPEISGKIQKDLRNGGSSGYSIVVNTKEGLRRKRFTIAHETAHYLLHRGAMGASIVDDTLYRSKLSNALEVQANRLAADILMPYPLIDEAMQGGTRDVQDLANLFKVSPAAMAIRLNIPVP